MAGSKSMGGQSSTDPSRNYLVELNRPGDPVFLVGRNGKTEYARQSFREKSE